MDTPPLGLYEDPQESGFRDWYSKVAAKAKINPNPDDPNHHYDYRAFYRDMMAGGKPIAPEKAGEHFTSEYKTAGHPRTYLPDSKGKIFNTKTTQYAAGGAVPERELVASERADDMPGMDEEKAKKLKAIVAALSARRGGFF